MCCIFYISIWHGGAYRPIPVDGRAEGSLRSRYLGFGSTEGDLGQGCSFSMDTSPRQTNYDNLLVLPLCDMVELFGLGTFHVAHLMCRVQVA